MAAAAAPGCEIQYIQQYNSSDSEAASDNWESESWNHEAATGSEQQSENRTSGMYQYGLKIQDTFTNQY